MKLLAILILMLIPFGYSTTTTTMCDDFECSANITGAIIGDFITTGVDMLFPSTASKYIFIILMMAIFSGGAYVLSKSWVLSFVMAITILLFGGFLGMVSEYFVIMLMIVMALIIAYKFREVFTGG